MTLDTIHPAFEDRMMLRQVELGVRLEMAVEAGRGVFARIHDKFPAPAAAGDVFASRTVTRLAPG